MKTQLTFALFVALCTGSSLFAQSNQGPMFSGVYMGVLKPDDALRVSISAGNNHFTLVSFIREDGTMRVPMMMDGIPAAALTLSQLHRTLEQRYSERLIAPIVTVAFIPNRTPWWQKRNWLNIR